MKLIRFGSRGAEKPGIFTNEGLRKDCSDLVEDWNRDFFQKGALSEFRSLHNLDQLPDVPQDARWAPPIARPGKVVGIALNYFDHAAEMNMPIPSEPIIFLKATSAISGPYDPIIIPRKSHKTDWEMELGVVLGRDAKYLGSPQESEQLIAGYCIAHDVSERHFQFDCKGQWTKGKSCDSFNPVGPWLTTADEISDVRNLDMSLDVNGVRKQTGNTSRMIFDVYFLVYYLSQFMTLEAGDLIITGTPPGVGFSRKPPEYLKTGDVVTINIAHLGSQRSVCVEDYERERSQ